MSDRDFVIGIDFGSDSVRALIVDAADGAELSSAVSAYSRWQRGEYCNAAESRFRQHPLDYIEGLELCVKAALADAPEGTAENIRGITIDTTGSTPVAVDKAGVPLALKPEFADNPNAMFVLWKDHTAIAEAQQINDLSRSWGGVDYTRYEGGIYSSEWFWAKVLHILREDGAVREQAFSWVEHCDWMPALLAGETDPLKLKRSRCAAGHKAMWHEEFEGLPAEEFLVKLDPLLAGLRGRLYRETSTVDAVVGNLCPEWAERLGLSESVVIGVGAFDAHLGAVGAGIKPYVLAKVMGTSTCDMLVAPNADMEGCLISGICGQVDGSILPGMQGMEAGQSAFGDVYSWFKKLLMWPLTILRRQIGAEISNMGIDFIDDRLISELSKQAEVLPIGASGITAVDWFNGRRAPDANGELKGVLAGLTLGSDAPALFRSLVEATAFGSKAILDRFESEGVAIKEVIALGGVAKKSPFVMQVMADVLNREIGVVGSDQTCALGAAMCAAAVAGRYDSVEDARDAMEGGIEEVYRPIAENVEAYKPLYKAYCRLGSFQEQ